MEFIDKYTTTAKITADKEGYEAKKVVLSADTFALCEQLAELTNQLKRK